MALNIYDKNGILKLTVEPADSSTHQHAIQEDNALNLSFVIPEYIMLDVNDYADFDSVRYWIIEQYVPQQKSTVEWSYNCKFYGIESLIKRGLVLKLVDNEMQPVFALTAPARQHMALLVDNINRIFGTTDYKVGEVISTENIHIDYNSTYISDGLSELAKQAGTEWWFDGMTVNLIRCEHGAEITLGYRNGLTKLERTTANSVKFFTRLFPLGSTRNIDYSTYGYSRLQLPGGQKYIEQNVAAYGVIEHSEEDAFSHIYPRRVGTISVVRSEEKTGTEGNPFKIYYFKDIDIPFDPNDYEIGGLVKHIQFESGELNGRDFEVNYNSDTKEFEIITQFPEYSDQLPNDILIPKIGDKYVLWNLTMPSEYYGLAEQEFKEAVDAYMADNNLDKSVYKGPTDYIDIAKRSVKLVIGQRIRLESNEFFPGTGYRNSRITRITRKINFPTQVDVEISDVLSVGKVTALENSVSEIKTIIESTREGLPDIIKTWEGTPASDWNLFSALRSKKEFLSRLDNDVAGGLIKFLQGSEFGQFIDSMIAGRGAAIDNDGNAQVESIKVRGAAMFLELIYNRLNAMEGDYSFVESGTIDELHQESDTAYLLHLRKRFDNDFIPFVTDDIIYGVWNYGNGFYTSWMRVISVDASANTMLIVTGADDEVPSGKNYPPVVGMNVARRGNFTDTSRQRSFHLSSYDGNIVFLDGVDNYKITKRNRALCLGLPTSLPIPDGLPIDPEQPYLYARGIIVQDLVRVDHEGKIIKEIRDNGEWKTDVQYVNSEELRVQDDVWWINCRWRCVVEKSTVGLAPTWDSQEWIMVSGDRTLALTLGSTNGWMFRINDVNTTLIATVWQGKRDITSLIQNVDWSWTRDSGDMVSDTAWDQAHANVANTLQLSLNDMGNNWINSRRVKFVCTAYYRDEEVKEVSAYLNINV